MCSIQHCLFFPAAFAAFQFFHPAMLLSFSAVFFQSKWVLVFLFSFNLLVFIPMQWSSHLHTLPNQFYLPASLSLTVFKYLGALRCPKDNTYRHKALVSTSTFALNSKCYMNLMYQADFKQLKKAVFAWCSREKVDSIWK